MTVSSAVKQEEGIVFNIERYAIHDGPGIRTLVFLKGCPLHCQWCSNPESINPAPEIGFRRSYCDGCGKCLPACPQGAISLTPEGKSINLDREKCNNCGECAVACTRDALHMYGRKMTAADVFEQARRDELFYRRSGGGVTLSGGEPLFQPRFAIAILKLCREAGIHTAIETTGLARREVLEEVLRELDLAIFDLKLIDEALHQKMTGQRNDLILRNARKVLSSGIPCQPRLPLIPTVNDTPENIQATAAFLKEAGLKELELMPYHGFGIGKYESLGREYKLSAVQMLKIEEVNRIRDAFQALGINCKISL